MGQIRVSQVFLVSEKKCVLLLNYYTRDRLHTIRELARETGLVDMIELHFLKESSEFFMQ